MSIADLEAAGLTPLAYFEQALKRLNYAVAYQPPQNNQAEHLLVVAGRDTEDQKIMARFRFLDLEQTRLELLFVLPLTPTRSKEQDINQLATYFNRSVPIGAFFASSEWGLCYRYQLLGDSGWFSLNLIVNSLQQMLKTSLLCLPYFNDLLMGEPLPALFQRLESESQHAPN